MATSATVRGRVLLPGPSVSLLQNLSGVSGWPWQEDRGDPDTRATGGGLVLVCNLGLDCWILGYRYGYVAMSRYTGLRVICQHVPLYNPYVDMRVYPGGS